MENFVEKIREYVNMEGEISPGEFQGFYKDVMEKLTADFEKLSEEELFQANAIVSIVSTNANVRGKRKGPDAKKFRKMHEKSKFWADAIEYRLKKSGLNEGQIKERKAEMEKSLYSDRKKEDEAGPPNGEAHVEAEPSGSEVGGLDSEA
jgi:hypothetical protein